MRESCTCSEAEHWLRIRTAERSLTTLPDESHRVSQTIAKAPPPLFLPLLTGRAHVASSARESCEGFPPEKARESSQPDGSRGGRGRESSLPAGDGRSSLHSSMPEEGGATQTASPQLLESSNRPSLSDASLTHTSLTPFSNSSAPSASSGLLTLRLPSPPLTLTAHLSSPCALSTSTFTPHGSSSGSSSPSERLRKEASSESSPSALSASAAHSWWREGREEAWERLCLSVPRSLHSLTKHLR